ncbi:MAG: cysteine hydrolase family protein [Planctomycetaceae bacterium]|nr:cysteine hydrolase family protein [Planctomycetaceae bacterium]
MIPFFRDSTMLRRQPFAVALLLFGLVSPGFLALIVGTGASRAEDRPTANLNITTRQQVKVEGQPDQFRSAEKHESWNPAKTAIIIIDMWDTHSCRSAAQRVAEMAPHVNRTISAARDKGVFIIHAPSDCMDFYKEAPQRHRAVTAPLAETSVKFQWNYFNPDREGSLADKLEKGGCSCDTLEPCGPSRIVWQRQIDAIKIHPADAITANGQEVYNLLQDRGIDNVIIIGVHTNRCVLGRPFGIRQMVSLKKNVVLCRDLTDSFHRDPGHHFEGLDQIISHVEKYWCPTITSENLTGQPPFRFQQALAPKAARPE